MKIEAPFNEQLNMDTATPENLQETNEKLVEYLDESGEKNASKHVQRLSDNQQKPKNEEKKDDPIKRELVQVNKQIRDTLNKIHKDMFDEQDTSIKKKGKSPKKSQTKAKATPKATPKSPKATPKAPMAKGLGKGLLTGAILGLIAGVGMALYDGYSGFTDEGASSNLGMDPKELTAGNKSASAAGSVISGLSFGFADAGETSKGVNNLFGGNKVIEKYDKLGIIDHDTIGNSDVEDWDKLGKLHSSEIKQIMDIDDWSESDLKKMKSLHEKAYKSEASQREKTKAQDAPKEKELKSQKLEKAKVKAQAKREADDPVYAFKMNEERSKKAEQIIKNVYPSYGSVQEVNGFKIITTFGGEVSADDLKQAVQVQKQIENKTKKISDGYQKSIDKIRRMPAYKENPQKFENGPINAYKMAQMNAGMQEKKQLDNLLGIEHTKIKIPEKPQETKEKPQPAQADKGKKEAVSMVQQQELIRNTQTYDRSTSGGSGTAVGAVINNQKTITATSSDDNRALQFVQ